MANADRLIEIFDKAKARPPGVERERFLAETCHDEPELREQVVSLLQSHEGAGDFLKNTVLSPTVLITEKRGDLMEFCKTNPPTRLLRSPVADVKFYDGVKFIAQDRSWLMLRNSKTEPILRIYAEAKSEADARKLLKLGMQLTRQV